MSANLLARRYRDLMRNYALSWKELSGSGLTHRANRNLREAIRCRQAARRLEKEAA